MKEVDEIFGSKDLPMQVKYSCDANPIYDTLAANKVNTSLNSSDVTYHSFTSTMERRKKHKITKKSISKSAISTPTPPSSSPSSSASHDYQDSELLSLLMKDIPTQSPTPPRPLGSSESETVEGKVEKMRKKTPSPPLRRVKFCIKDSKASETSPQNQKLPVTNGAPSYGYSRLEHFKGKTKFPPPPIQITTAKPNRNDSTTNNNEEGEEEEALEHEYAEVNHNHPPRKAARVGQKKGRFEKAARRVMSQNGSSTPPPVPPMRGTEAPRKPPRARQRWEKKVEREGRGHKALRNTDALRVSVTHVSPHICTLTKSSVFP